MESTVCAKSEVTERAGCIRRPHCGDYSLRSILPRPAYEPGRRSVDSQARALVAASRNANRARTHLRVEWLSRNMSMIERLKTWAPFGAVPEVEPEALRDALASDTPPVLVDVRTRAEWTKSRIEGAVSVPILEFADRLDALGLERGQPIVAICLSAHRSIPAVRLLRERGFERVAQLRGGMLAWWGMKLPTLNGHGE